jgi:hypothetical protein
MERNALLQRPAVVYRDQVSYLALQIHPNY